MTDDLAMFSEQARYVVTFAQEEGQRRGHDTLHTEHLLIGLMNHVQGNAMLAALNVPVPHAVNTLPLSHRPTEPPQPLAVSPGVQRVIGLAREETDDPDLRSDAVGLEHLLVGLVREEKGAAGRKLRDHGVTPERVRRYVVGSAIEVAKKIDAGAELRIWGTQDAMNRLLELSSRQHKPIDDLVWEAIQRTWFTDGIAEPDTPDAQ